VTTPAPKHVPRDKQASDRFEAFIRRGVGKRGAFPYLVLATFTLAVGAGSLARLTDPDDFHSYGDAVWWALVTLTTVGYGDIVPKTTWGRVIGGFVMLLGITFISFLTATVTSLFISSEDNERESRTLAREQEYRSALKRIEDKLAAIESRLPNQQ
jgi:voltage-gated potassium channel